MSEFMKFLSQNLESRTFKILCDKFGGTKVYIAQDLSSLNYKIQSVYKKTDGAKSERIKKTHEILKTSGIFVGVKKIRWVVNNGEKKRN